MATNVTRLLGNLLATRPCVVFNGDASVYVEASELATYPDARVICGPVRRHPILENSVLNPVLLLEVLSPSTEAYDRGAKFSHYKRIASFTEYVLVTPASTPRCPSPRSTVTSRCARSMRRSSLSPRPS